MNLILSLGLVYWISFLNLMYENKENNDERQAIKTNNSAIKFIGPPKYIMQRKIEII